MTSLELVKKIAGLLDSKKAQEITAFEIRDLTTLGDYFVIASGSSNTQVRALSDAVEEGLSKEGIEPRRIEGYQTAYWITARLLCTFSMNRPGNFMAWKGFGLMHLKFLWMNNIIL